MKKKTTGAILLALSAATAGLFFFLIWILYEFVPYPEVRHGILAVCAGMFALTILWRCFVKRQVTGFADEICDMLGQMIKGDFCRQNQIYEDSLYARIQGKLLRFYDIVRETRKISIQDKKTIQELVSDISHQVKTPIANIKMFADILEKHDLPAQKQAQFLETMEKQIDKLDFLMQSLIKMSRLETGTFVLRVQDTDIAGTIAEAISPVWAKAEKKKIRIETECGSGILIRHDPKWTAEALGNILDNAVKYTSHGGRICIRVRPWQIYTRIDISDTGSGIDSRHYHDIFKRFYRAPEVSAQEGVGLGLYLAQEIIRQEKGYITVKSEKGRGTVFSVFLLS